MAAGGQLNFAHRDTLERLRDDLITGRVDTALVSAALVRGADVPALKALIEDFPGTPTVGLVSEIEEVRALAGALAFGQAGIRRLVGRAECRRTVSTPERLRPRPAARPICPASTAGTDGSPHGNRHRALLHRSVATQQSDGLSAHAILFCVSLLCLSFVSLLLTCFVDVSATNRGPPFREHTKTMHRRPMSGVQVPPTSDVVHADGWASSAPTEFPGTT
jgi:hypothetical protein